MEAGHLEQSIPSGNELRGCLVSGLGTELRNARICVSVEDEEDEERWASSRGAGSEVIYPGWAQSAHIRRMTNFCLKCELITCPTVTCDGCFGHAVAG